MPKLGDFIGALLSDVAQARVRADLETVRIAEAYAGHGLLKHLPVPRFRLPDLIIDVPVLVTSVGDVGEQQYGQPSASEVAAVVQDGLRAGDLHFGRGEPQRIARAGSQRLKELFAAGPQTLLAPGAIASDVTAAVSEAVRAAGPEEGTTERIALVERTVKAGLERLLVEKMIRSPHLEVLVTSGEIKAHADNESVVRVRLNVSEDAYEVVERDEGAGITLTPE